MSYDSNRHHRRSIRLKSFDYAWPGAYFVTTVTQYRECLFGEITDGAMTLNEIGRIIDTAWRSIPSHFQNTQLDEFIIMPNHFHGILWILDSPDRTGEAFAREAQTIDNPKMANASPQPKGTKPGSLNATLQNFKSISTRKINHKLKTPGNKIWQRDYYERIIRDERELNAIRKYILANPMKWTEDRDYPHG